MKKKEKNYVQIGLAVTIVALIIFATHLSGTLEIIVLIASGIAALTPAFLRLMEGENMRGIDMLLSVLLFAIFGGLFSWHSFNDEIRDDKRRENDIELRKLEAIEKAKEDSIKLVRIKAQSDSLYKIEGDRIFGDFYFGMSEKEFNSQVKRIKDETDGFVSIQGYDFYIDTEDCSFFHDKLYRIKLVSKYKSSIDYEYTRDEKSEIIASEEQKLFNLFKDKYGEPHDEEGWHFPYKDITVYYSCVNPFADEEYELREWASFICITQPDLSDQAEEERLIEKEKEELAKAKEDSIKRAKEERDRKKKESFVEGI